MRQQPGAIAEARCEEGGTHAALSLVVRQLPTSAGYQISGQEPRLRSYFFHSPSTIFS